jgi:hypothetical protein
VVTDAAELTEQLAIQPLAASHPLGTDITGATLAL